MQKGCCFTKGVTCDESCEAYNRIKSETCHCMFLQIGSLIYKELRLIREHLVGEVEA